MYTYYVLKIIKFSLIFTEKGGCPKNKYLHVFFFYSYSPPNTFSNALVFLRHYFYSSLQY